VAKPGYLDQSIFLGQNLLDNDRVLPTWLEEGKIILAKNWIAINELDVDKVNVALDESKTGKDPRSDNIGFAGLTMLRSNNDLPQFCAISLSS
jgi:hypothetical protein